MKALLIMAHGSPRAMANDDIRAVAAAIRGRNAFGHVEVGFLDCNDPDIPSAVDLCVEAGAEEIVAVPYLLHTGRHLVKDLPTLLQEAKLRHPGLPILMGDYLGHDPLMAEVLGDRVAAVRGR